MASFGLHHREHWQALPHLAPILTADRFGEGRQVTWTIFIPLEIPSQNVTEKGRSWRGRAAKTKLRRANWCQMCRFDMCQLSIPRATAPRSLHIIAYRTRRCSDIGNLIGGAKACVDGMADTGLILDDRDSKARITYDQAVASKSPTGKPCTVITVEDIAEEHPPTSSHHRRKVAALEPKERA